MNVLFSMRTTVCAAGKLAGWDTRRVLLLLCIAASVQLMGGCIDVGAWANVCVCVCVCVFTHAEGGGGNVLGTNMMTLQYPSLTQHQMAQAAVAGAGAAAAAAAATVATATVPRLGAGPSGLGLPGAGGAAAGFPGAGAGADQFGNWMARPAGPNELMNLAASGNAPIVSLLHQGGAAGSGGLGGAAPAPQ